jgi:ferredoxin
MCEFCVKHGEGEKWYLRARNYSLDLLSDVHRRRFIEGFFSKDGKVSDPLHSTNDNLKKLRRLPGFIQRAVAGRVTRRMKKWHFGQVLPLEDVSEIFGFVNSIVRVPCVCRRATVGEDARYCYGISLEPGGLAGPFKDLDESFRSGPDTTAFEQLTGEEALEAFAEHEKEGLCHTVWTFMTPFIGGICNCDRSDCMAMRSTVTNDVKVMFRAEYVAAVDPDLCAGCRSCMRVCQFGALTHSAATRKVVVDQTDCYGCGVCRSVCPSDAVKLVARAEAPIAAGLW